MSDGEKGMAIFFFPAGRTSFGIRIVEQERPCNGADGVGRFLILSYNVNNNAKLAGCAGNILKISHNGVLSYTLKLRVYPTSLPLPIVVSVFFGDTGYYLVDMLDHIRVSDTGDGNCSVALEDGTLQFDCPFAFGGIEPGSSTLTFLGSFSYCSNSQSVHITAPSGS